MPPSRLSKSMAEKKEVVTWIELHGVTPAKAADHFQNERGWKVSAAQVRYWWKQKESIKNAPVSNLRLRGAGAKPRLAEVEDMIFDQVLFLRSEKKKVSPALITELSKELARSELRDDSFVGSNKWADGFMRRYNLSLRRTTNLTVLTDDVLTERAVKFMEFLSARLCSLDLALTVFALLTAFSKAEEVDHTTISRYTASGDGGRLLRAVIMSDDEEMSLPVPSFIKSRVTNWRINSWIKNGYSDDYVLGKLRLTGLAGKPLTEHSNFKIFQKFKIDGWLKEKCYYNESLGPSWLNRITAAQVKTADGRSTYVGYVIALNEKTKNVDVEEWPKLLGGGSPTEMLCKAIILMLLRRDELEIKFMLDIPSLHRTP